MFEYLTQAGWSPYVAGAGIGVLVCFAFLLSDRPLGCSTAFVKARGLIGKVINRTQVEKNEYYREIIPQIDWAFTDNSRCHYRCFHIRCHIRPVSCILGAQSLGRRIWL